MVSGFVCECVSYSTRSFESFDAAAFFLAKDAALAAFALGRTTALVAEIGARPRPDARVSMLISPLIFSQSGRDESRDEENRELARTRTCPVGFQNTYLRVRIGLEKRTVDTTSGKKLQIDPPYVVTCAGASGTSASPVLDGWVDPKACRRSALGCCALDQELVARLGDQLGDLDARARRRAARCVREQRCRFVGDEDDSAEEAADSSSVFVLPDGRAVQLGECCVGLAERFVAADDAAAAPQLLMDCAKRHAPGEQAALLASVALSGGGSCLPGIVPHARAALHALARKDAPALQHLVTLVAADDPAQRRVGAWLGGSILASLSSFNEVVISRAEYEDEGAARLVDRKCP